MIALVKFIVTQDGGRIDQPASGYRSQVKVGDEYTSCTIETIDETNFLTLGQEHEVSLTLMLPELYVMNFHEGQAIDLYEGHHLVARGRVLRI